MKIEMVWKNFKRYSVITIAAFLYAIAVSLFTDPNEIAPGGITGLAIILSRLTLIETGTWILLLNIPILFVGAYKFGIQFIASTSYAIVMISFFSNRLACLVPATKDLLLASLAGGGLIAVSVGMILKCHATTGGTDILVKLLRGKYPFIKTGMLFLVIDVIIILLSAFVFRDIEKAMYAGISVGITAKLLDFVLYGSDEARIHFIISDKTAQISECLLREQEVGVTFLEAQGAYSESYNRMIMCVTKKQESPYVEEIVKKIDQTAFMIVSSATEIFGEGYKSFYSPKL